MEHTSQPTLNASALTPESRRTRAPYAVVVDDVTTELRRVTRRWQQLTAQQTRENASLLRDLAQQLADRTRREQALEPLDIPDLGDDVLAEQLTVTVYDACRTGLESLALQGLTQVRRALP